MGEMENLLVERLIASPWRLRRLGRLEAGIFALDLYGTMTNKHKHREVEERAREVKRVRNSEITALGQTFVEDAGMANAFSKLSRYETAIERSLYRALHELQRLQAARHAGSNVPPPAALDVDISGISRENL